MEEPMNIKAKKRGEEGFTLIELMVVVLVIAILLAIAIPTFLGARKRAQDSVAKTSLRNALSAANVMFTDAQTFATATESATTGLPTVEGSLTYVAAGTAATTGGKSISVAVTTTSTASDTWSASALSSSGTCFTVKIVAATGAVTYGSGATAATCTGTVAATATALLGGATGTTW
jgi:type IV pilus assembly protein PilA